MRTGNRKFVGFLITVVLYTVVILVAVFKIGVAGGEAQGLAPVLNGLAAFAVQASMGYCGICGLFFGSNVLEHFAGKGNINNTGETSAAADRASVQMENGKEN